MVNVHTKGSGGERTQPENKKTQQKQILRSEWMKGGDAMSCVCVTNRQIPWRTAGNGGSVKAYSSECEDRGIRSELGLVSAPDSYYFGSEMAACG